LTETILENPSLWEFIKGIELAGGGMADRVTIYDSTGKECNLVVIRGKGGAVEVQIKR
jgi:hypothetical protein